MATGAKAAKGAKTRQILAANVYTSAGCAIREATRPGLHNTTPYIFELFPAEFFAGQIVFCTHRNVQFLGAKSCQKLWYKISLLFFGVFGFAPLRYKLCFSLRTKPGVAATCKTWI
jgi:hypothetical protein